MIVYLAKTNLKLDTFSLFEILQIPREHNSDADALARLEPDIDEEGLGTVPIESLSRPSISRDKVPTSIYIIFQHIFTHIPISIFSHIFVHMETHNSISQFSQSV